VKDHGQSRKNFVSINMKKNYQQRTRGAAFNAKIMCKKSNSLKSRARFAKKIQIEQMKNRDQVSVYGGLGKVGMDYQGRK